MRLHDLFSLRRAPLLLAFAVLLMAGSSVRADEIYVSPQGRDAAPGTPDSPVATLSHAVELAQPLRHAGHDVRIVLRGGRYQLDETLVLSDQEAGRLAFVAFPGETPIISGGVPVTNWRRVPAAEEPAGTTTAAHGHLWVADLPATRGGAWRFHALYDGLDFLPRARSREYLTRSKHVGLAERLEHRDRLEYPAGSIKPWSNLDDVEILSRPNHNWLVNYLPIASIDEATLTLRTAVPATYTPTGRFWVENVMEALDEPGEWVLNTHEGRLYLWPRGPQPDGQILAPRLTTLIRVAGRPDDWGDHDQPVTGVSFTGLTFAHTDRDVWRPNDAGLQHDWAMWDKDDACLRFRVARDCQVRDCTFVAAGGFGVRADLYAQDISIRGSTFHDLGSGGVLLCGYGPGTKDVNHGNEVVDNEFYRTGRLWWHAPAVFLWQSGRNRVSHNYLHDLPYNGIVLSGVRPRHFGVATPKIPNPKYPPGIREDMRTMRWREIGNPRTIDETLKYAHTRDNLISENEIHDAMQVLDDGNAIYLSAAGKGNVVRRNVIYRMGHSAAIRTDDDQSYCRITENVTIGSGIVVKDYNETWNNLMINGGLRIISDRIDSRIERNVYVAYAPSAEFYVVDVVNSYFGNAKDDTMLGNYNPAQPPIIPPHTDENVFSCGNPAAARAFVADMRRKWGNDRTSIVADPQLEDPAHGDFRFKPGSPAAALGIVSVDTRHVGLLREPMCERLRHTAGLDLSVHGPVQP
ncbi:MAG TPA: hypothetical protein VHE61_02105 [Opitutaceae bacterium]|nr:hypothetical protein [Opitutaceae bacterium]